MSWQEYLPIAAILVPLGTLFIVRTLDKGEKKKTSLEADLKEIQSFVNTNKTLIARLVERLDDFDERTRRIENDLSRIAGRLNGNSHG